MSNNNFEIERKWVVRKKDIQFDLSKFVKHNISQGFIYTNPCIRVRKKDNKYYLTIKISNENSNLKRYEFENEISENDFNNLKNKCEGIFIEKNRYEIPYLKYIIELDIFENDFTGLIVAEVEFDNIDDAKKFIPPNWFFNEVTDDIRFTNAKLSKKNKEIIAYITEINL